MTRGSIRVMARGHDVLGHRAEELARLDGQSADAGAAGRPGWRFHAGRDRAAACSGPCGSSAPAPGRSDVCWARSEVVGPQGSARRRGPVTGGGAGHLRRGHQWRRAGDGDGNIELVEADLLASLPCPPTPVDAGASGGWCCPTSRTRVATIRRAARVADARPAVYLALEYDTEAVPRDRRSDPAASPGSAELLNAAFAAAGTPQTLGPRPWPRMLAVGRSCRRAEPGRLQRLRSTRRTAARPGDARRGDRQPRRRRSHGHGLADAGDPRACRRRCAERVAVPTAVTDREAARPCETPDHDGGAHAGHADWPGRHRTADTSSADAWAAAGRVPSTTHVGAARGCGRGRTAPARRA